jgi:hypothetical protein
MSLRQLGVSLACMAAGACAPRADARHAAAPVRSSQPTPSEFATGGLVAHHSHSLEFPIEIPLPHAARWRLSDGPNWLVASDTVTGSEIAVRTWRAPRSVRRAECEAEARLIRVGIPVVSDDSIIERRVIRAPAGFDSELTVGVSPVSQGVAGYAQVFGASVARCYAALFSTRVVAGPGAEEDLGRRLQVIVEGVFERARLHDVDDRGERSPLLTGE